MNTSLDQSQAQDLWNSDSLKNSEITRSTLIWVKRIISFIIYLIRNSNVYTLQSHNEMFNNLYFYNKCDIQLNKCRWEIISKRPHTVFSRNTLFLPYDREIKIGLTISVNIQINDYGAEKGEFSPSVLHKTNKTKTLGRKLPPKGSKC